MHILFLVEGLLIFYWLELYVDIIKFCNFIIIFVWVGWVWVCDSITFIEICIIVCEYATYSENRKSVGDAFCGKGLLIWQTCPFKEFKVH